VLFVHGVTLTFGGLAVVESLDIAVKEGIAVRPDWPERRWKDHRLHLLSGVYQPTAERYSSITSALTKSD